MFDVLVLPASDYVSWLYIIAAMIWYMKRKTVNAGIDGGFETGLPVDFLETTTSVSEVVEVDATQPPPGKMLGYL